MFSRQKIFDAFALDHGTHTGRLTFKGPAEPWFYIAVWANNLAVGQAGDLSLRTEIDLEVSGSALIGLLSSDAKTFITEMSVSGRKTIILNAPFVSQVRSLILRNDQGGNSPTVRIHAIRTTLIEPIPTEGMSRGFLAKDIFRDMAALLKKDDPVIVDVGANEGKTVDDFLTAFPRASVFAIEPLPSTYARLSARFANDRRVKMFCEAISTRSGPATFFTYRDDSRNSLLPISDLRGLPVDGGNELVGKVEVSMQSLTEFLQQQKLPRVDILKIDAQGHDADILDGALELLKSGAVRLALVELIFQPAYEDQGSPGSLIMAMENSGFRIYDFYEFHYRNGLFCGDALFEWNSRTG